MTDHETTTSIVDPNNHASISVRVWFTHNLIEPHEDDPHAARFTTSDNINIIGVYRLDDDSEIDFSGLPVEDQIKVEKACENYMKEQSKK